MPQEKKKIIMYFKKKRPGLDPFLKFEKKRSVYHSFFKKGKELGFDMFLASGPKTYLGGLGFENPAFFDGKEFVIEKRIIMADAIYDRSGGIDFPPKEINDKVLNCSEFKILCNDKNKMYEYFGNFMPKSFKINSQLALEDMLENFPSQTLAVLKPAKGLGGKGIVIDTIKNLKKIKVSADTEYSLQEFIDTSCGIKGITNEKHDLRIVIANGKIVLAHLRTPRAGSYLANAAQGGTIREILLEQIPDNVLKITKEMQKTIDVQFNYPIYSIDFGVTAKSPFVFELNDQIGFPSEEMKNAPTFIENILLSLTKLSNA